MRRFRENRKEAAEAEKKEGRSRRAMDLKKDLIAKELKKKIQEYPEDKDIIENEDFVNTVTNEMEKLFHIMFDFVFDKALAITVGFDVSGGTADDELDAEAEFQDLDEDFQDAELDGFADNESPELAELETEDDSDIPPEIMRQMEEFNPTRKL